MRAQDAVRAAVTNVALAELQPNIKPIICQVFEDFGSNSTRDNNARANLAFILNDIALSNPSLGVEIRMAISSLSTQDTQWQELCIDLPLAVVMIDELRSRIR